MTAPVTSPPAGVGFHAVHEPHSEDREPKTRRPMMVWDRIKILVILTLFIVLSASYQQSRIPVMSFGEALSRLLREKWWLPVLMGIEVVRQIHYLISERSVPWHQFWQKKVFGGWERRMGRLNPWSRYRPAAAEQVGALHRARVPVLLLEVGHPPHRRPRHRTRAVHGHPLQADDRLAAVVLAADPLLVHGDLQHRDLLHVLLLRRHRHLQARRDQDPLRRRLGPGPGAAPGQRDRRLPRATGRDRGKGRPRPQRHPAVGAARHRQDADGRGRRR